MEKVAQKKSKTIMNILVAGGGGFIGSHLVIDLLRQGHFVRAVDIKPLDQWNQIFDDAENVRLDLRKFKHCIKAVAGMDIVYNLAASMGGMGFIETHKAECMLNSLINTHLLMAARRVGVRRFFFASSACVYAADKQLKYEANPLKETDAYPAEPEDGYGWEKLFSERMCRHFSEDYGLETRVARYHNVYGTHTTYQGGREKAPAAICRKVIEAKLNGKHEIEIWGDGSQTRSFTWIEDAITGTGLIMCGDYRDPVNLGSSELISILDLAGMVMEIAGLNNLDVKFDLDAPKGVNGRNSDNTLIKDKYGWEPSTQLRDGMEKLYAWVHDQIAK